MTRRPFTVRVAIGSLSSSPLAAADVPVLIAIAVLLPLPMTAALDAPGATPPAQLVPVLQMPEPVVQVVFAAVVVSSVCPLAPLAILKLPATPPVTVNVPT